LILIFAAVERLRPGQKRFDFPQLLGHPRQTSLHHRGKAPRQSRRDAENLAHGVAGNAYRFDPAVGDDGGLAFDGDEHRHLRQQAAGTELGLGLLLAVQLHGRPVNDKQGAGTCLPGPQQRLARRMNITRVHGDNRLE
jgi:hypothetical protein